MKSRKLRNALLGFVVPIIIIIAWYYSTTYTNMPQTILPSIKKVGETFLEMLKSGQLWGDLQISLSRVLKGFLVSAILGIILGAAMGMSEIVEALFMPIVTTIRQIPIIAWIPLIILWCGIGELSKVVIIVFASFFPILVNTHSGIANTPDEYIEVARLYKLNKWKTFTKVYLPNALPQILVGLKLGLSISWMAVVAAELIAATSGIGYRMSDARSTMHSDILIVCMLVVGLIGIIMDKGLTCLFRLVTPWRNKIQKN